MEVYCDGAWCPELPGKPGIIAASVMIDGREIKTWRGTVRAVDSNSAELIAIIIALQWAEKKNKKEATILTDSQVAIRYINSDIVTRKYHELVRLIRELSAKLKATIVWIPRDKNHRADNLCRLEKQKLLRCSQAA